MKKALIIGAGCSPGQAQAIVGLDNWSANNGAVTTLAGTTQATAVQMSYCISAVTGASNTGGLLPQNASPGDRMFVANTGANTIKVYPATAAGTINGGSAAASISLATLKAAEFVQVGSGDTWYYVVTG